MVIHQEQLFPEPPQHQTHPSGHPLQDTDAWVDSVAASARPEPYIEHDRLRLRGTGVEVPLTSVEPTTVPAAETKEPHLKARERNGNNTTGQAPRAEFPLPGHLAAAKRIIFGSDEYAGVRRATTLNRDIEAGKYDE